MVIIITITIIKSTMATIIVKIGFLIMMIVTMVMVTVMVAVVVLGAMVVVVTTE